ncbi:LytTR family transcriptional regulator [Peribacillus psychrosaccharolyticus]|uniref:LytTR family transcriptional regulator n=1 Tax=Peribacillus psychrosaccharolyticus TaxID=1407 RepID=A0A974S0M8_PERPY|nr:LytTR family DNA-binding domain-containing protein [Peribacillus psychrosaccharolyticus]MEC2056309.1 LytTR family DNA-binding domain-containing protein [Peribacillus psychrosaccharolyticus]MED3743711.1 LytTR family DNA-binding domain-containing protein [Peribacillus psychrosaccharolyticus]QQT00523.1 LytTR family transcriptional regulator [Peribacillus psychrosaccharolyticus]
MKVNIDLHDQYDELTITIQAKEMTPELSEIIRKLQIQSSKRLVGVEEDKTILLSPSEVDYVFAEKRKVYGVSGQRKIEMKLKLFELEELLAPQRFMRFSKSVIGNLDQIDHFELTFNGILCVHFKSGTKEYVSRSYVAELKKKLILGGGEDGK